MNKAEKTTELMKKAKDFIPDGGYSEKELNLAFFMFIKGYHQAEKDLELSWQDIYNAGMAKYEEPVNESIEPFSIEKFHKGKKKRRFIIELKSEVDKVYTKFDKYGFARYFYEVGKEKVRQQIIDNACKYLRIHCDEVETEDNGIAGWISDEFIEDFRKYMEG